MLNSTLKYAYNKHKYLFSRDIININKYYKNVEICGNKNAYNYIEYQMICQVITNQIQHQFCGLFNNDFGCLLQILSPWKTSKYSHQSNGEMLFMDQNRMYIIDVLYMTLSKKLTVFCSNIYYEQTQIYKI